MLDADFCEHKCPICTRARQGKPIARLLQRLEMFLTGGGCPAGKARLKKYGVKPNDKLKESS